MVPFVQPCSTDGHFKSVEDLVHDVTLFPYKHETVLLDLDEFAAKTYNAMQTVIAVNAVDTERVGPVSLNFQVFTEDN
jgi:hypothetical protein